MKSPMNQAVPITLLILFASALSLTVALISLFYINQNSATNPSPSVPTTEDYESVLPSLSESSEELTTPLLTTSFEEELPAPEDLGNGLAFSSNGDGTCTLTGIGICEDVCIVIPEFSPSGDTVTAIATRAFWGCGQATAIQIPSTVTSIGALAFANCPNLMYISVHAENREFCDIDGILYTSDGRALLLYPPMRAGNAITISSVTTEIMEMAFYNCAYLTHIYYAGTPEQWEQIRIGSKNYSLTAAAMTFCQGN